MNIGQSYEICYLTQCISEKTKKRLATYLEPKIANLVRECKELNCSANALGQLYYAASILEQIPAENIQTIIEFGGGYGCLAHIFRSVLPETSIYIIDIPELIAVQYVYLKNALPHEDIYVYTQNNKGDLQKNGIHLIPTHIMTQLELQADVFVSNFALSEVTADVQEIVIKKRFFDARLCYITGQLDGWGTYGFENHNGIHKNLRTYHEKVVCRPFHLLLNSLKSYEIMAYN